MMNLIGEIQPVSKSPLSTLPPKKIRDLPRTFLLDRLADYYGARPPAEAVECDYALWECAETGLQFAWPAVPGSLRFYEWVSGFASYYPGIRWEYGEVRRRLAADAGTGKNFKLLDVGCGKGDFLQGLDFIPSENKYALDLNEPAVVECRRLGFQACCGTMDTALAAGFFKAGEFPAVTSFHCLEHVDQPVEFVRSLMGAVAPGGRLFISTPYSPMSFEPEWFDILNHPPHHMTRWNLAAYQRLAEITGAKMRYFTPPSSPFRRAVRNFRLLQYGPHGPAGKAALLKDLVRRFPEFLRHYRKQKQRLPVGADVILVEFTVS
ncbi:MAG: class I SAM-dependent methyltransferase [Verrucomicrobiales bacterium]|nr:class I SAM-dependent methyltransferase [Verrucomicrobiales bacterium]